VGPALERRPATEAVAIMEPEGCGLLREVVSMAREAYLAARKTESVFVRIIFMKPMLSSSQNTFREEIPALAKKTSSLPYSFRASATTDLTSSSSAASNCRACMSTPGYKLSSSLLCSARCEFAKSQMYTAFAPWRANWCAEARPMPRGELAPASCLF